MAPEGLRTQLLYCASHCIRAMLPVHL